MHHDRQLSERQLAQHYRRELAARYANSPSLDPTTGYVVIYHGEVTGWIKTLDDNASAHRPGCIAVAPDATQYRATGGDDYNGAPQWKRVN